MRIGVLRNNQLETDKPDRFVSKSAAGGFLRHLTHERISKYVIREVLVKAALGGSLQYQRSITPSSDPGRHFIPKLRIKAVSELLPPGLPTNLVLYYPVKDQSSYAKQNFLRMYGCNQAEWSAKFGSGLSSSSN